METSPRAALVLRGPLDYDSGDTNFVLTIMASVRKSYLFYWHVLFLKYRITIK